MQCNINPPIWQCMLAKLVTYVRETWGNIDVALPIHTKNTIAVESNTVLKKKELQ